MIPDQRLDEQIVKYIQEALRQRIDEEFTAIRDEYIQKLEKKREEIIGGIAVQFTKHISMQDHYNKFIIEIHKTTQL